jgi:hypothetical protein
MLMGNSCSRMDEQAGEEPGQVFDLIGLGILCFEKL